MNRLIILSVLILTLLVGNPAFSADFQKGLDATQKGDFTTALKDWKPLAQQGDADAQYILGVMDRKGQGVPQKDKTAVKWFKLAAEQGNSEAQTQVEKLQKKIADQNELRELQARTKQGDVPTQFNLGRMYMYGNGVPQNYKTAEKWFKLAAEQGHVYAQYNLGQMYRLGKGVPQDYKTAVKWYRLAAEQGNADAQSSLGVMYHEGEGVPQNYKTVVKWHTLAAEQGIAVAQSNLGLMYRKGKGVPKNDKTAVKWFKLAAEQGNSEAQTQVEKLQKKIELQELQARAKQGTPVLVKKLGPSFNCGKAYYSIEHVICASAKLSALDRELSKAYKNAKAQLKSRGSKAPDLLTNQRYWNTERYSRCSVKPIEDCLSNMYRERIAELVQLSSKCKQIDQTGVAGLNQAAAALNCGDYDTALKMFSVLAEQGNAIAQNTFGMMHSKRMNYQEAVKWFRKAAEQGHDGAQHNLAVSYSWGRGVTQNYNEAAKWYRILAEKGNEDAQIELGRMYRDGVGYAKNHKESVYWFKKAAEQGSNIAQNDLGKMYNQDMGDTKDHIQAHMWFNISATTDPYPWGTQYKEARKNINIIEKRMSSAQIAEAKKLVKEWIAKHQR